MAKDLKRMYRTIVEDHFPPAMEISFVDGKERQTLFYERVSWKIEGKEKGLRYGENPGQEAALYRLVNGNLTLGETRTIAPESTSAGVPDQADQRRSRTTRTEQPSRSSIAARASSSNSAEFTWQKLR